MSLADSLLLAGFVIVLATVFYCVCAGLVGILEIVVRKARSRG